MLFLNFKGEIKGENEKGTNVGGAGIGILNSKKKGRKPKGLKGCGGFIPKNIRVSFFFFLLSVMGRGGGLSFYVHFFWKEPPPVLLKTF